MRERGLSSKSIRWFLQKRKKDVHKPERGKEAVQFEEKTCFSQRRRMQQSFGRGRIIMQGERKAFLAKERMRLEKGLNKATGDGYRKKISLQKLSGKNEGISPGKKESCLKKKGDKTAGPVEGYLQRGKEDLSEGDELRGRKRWANRNSPQGKKNPTAFRTLQEEVVPYPANRRGKILLWPADKGIPCLFPKRGGFLLITDLRTKRRESYREKSRRDRRRFLGRYREFPPGKGIGERR